MHTKDSITKWKGEKNISNCDRYSEVNDWFIITLHIVLEICLRDCVIPLFPKRYINL